MQDLTINNKTKFRSIISFFIAGLLLLACSESPKSETASPISPTEPTVAPALPTTLPSNESIAKTTYSSETTAIDKQAIKTPVLSKPSSLPKASKESTVTVKPVQKMSPSIQPSNNLNQPILTPEKDPANAKPTDIEQPVVFVEQPVVFVEQTKAVSNEDWNQLLSKYVSSTGKVNYKGLKTEKKALEAYIQFLSDNTPQESWSKAEKMAYWINAYNAFTVKLIVDNLPVSSILKLDNGKTWEVKRISLGNKKYSLNQIENDILRPQFKDARIHFAINCAAKSCPPLLNQAFTADNLETLLEKQTQNFINNSQYNQIKSDKAQVSKIFEWYAADFGDLRKFLNRYSAVKINNGAVISHNEYDWDLND